MKFIDHDLGYLRGSEIVEVSLKGSAANVRLMDSLNRSNYKAGRRHRYFGGHAKRSPVKLHVPSAGHWHVVIDLGGYGGQIRSGVRVLPDRLKPIQEQPLSSVPSLLRPDESELSQPQEDESYDVFISLASVDTGGQMISKKPSMRRSTDHATWLRGSAAVADIVGVHRSYVPELVSRHNLPAFKYLGRWTLLTEDLSVWMRYLKRRNYRVVERRCKKDS